MQFKLRKVGNSLGVLIPRDFAEAYREGDFIELHFGKMDVKTQEMTSGAIPIDPPQTYKVGEVFTVKPRVGLQALRKTACKKHHGSYSCGCL